MSDSEVMPVNTKRVARPPFFPNRMSVFNLSPTMMVLLGSNGCLALTQSNIVTEGFPMDMGSFPRAYRRGALMEPAPGKRPWASGYVLSSFVTRNLQPGFLIRYWKALEILV